MIDPVLVYKTLQILRKIRTSPGTIGEHSYHFIKDIFHYNDDLEDYYYKTSFDKVHIQRLFSDGQCLIVINEGYGRSVSQMILLKDLEKFL